MPETVAIIGYGAIGKVIAGGLLDENGPKLHAVLVRPQQLDEARANLPPGVRVVTTLAELLLSRPNIVVESAGQGAVREHGAGILSAGADLIVASTGALAEDDLLGQLRRTAAAAGVRIMIPAGAIAGLDGLGALKAAGLTTVTYTSCKPPLAWRGTPAEGRMELGALRERTIIFEGSAREAALNVPEECQFSGYRGTRGHRPGPYDGAACR
ncbi:hypothetical protein JNW90_21335 [Micromonospora sp. STR1s_5]|nr:hypothetical protein [Micromonospora sp. STR1s_5]